MGLSPKISSNTYTNNKNVRLNVVVLTDRKTFFKLKKNIRRNGGQKAVIGASVYLRKYCLFLMKHCLTFSCEQPTIPYRNRNSTEFLYLFILVYATKIINNDYNKVSLVNSTGINYILLQNKNTYAARRLSESVPSSVQPRTFFVYFHSMSAEVCI